MDARCAVHPESTATATCARCGSHTCPACLDANRETNPDAVCVTCRERLDARGLVHHVEWLAVCMMLHGAAVSAMGIVIAGTLAVVGSSALAAGAREAGAGFPAEEVAPFVLLGAAAFAAVAVAVGVVQLLGGYWLRRFENRWLVWLGIACGPLAIVTCYCVLTGVPLAIWGLIVMLDTAVAERFRVRSLSRPAA